MTGSRNAPTSHTNEWALHDAKAKLSEVVRKAKSEGPQRITVRSREEVVVMSVAEYRRMTGQRSGAELVKVMQESPLYSIPEMRASIRKGLRTPVKECVDTLDW